MSGASASEKVQEHPDGRVELVLSESGERALVAKGLCNEDLLPVPIARRTWTTWHYAALWISMAHCLTTYYYASGLIKQGMSWKEALLTIAVGNVIVLIPILLNSHPGTRYGIPFPVFARAAYGTMGANLPAIMRALVACGWFGIQCWIGGHAIHILLGALIPGWHTLLGGFAHVLQDPLKGQVIVGTIEGHTTTEWISFLIFWAINVAIIWKGMDLLRAVESWAAPFVLVMTGILLWWAIDRAGSMGDILARPSRLTEPGAFLKAFVPGVTAMIGYWATLSLNMSDFTRYGQSQRSQAWGQVLALPTTMTGFAAMGVIITSATFVIFHEEIWDPIDLVARFDSWVVIAVMTFTVAVATLAVNIAANVVSPANDFSNALPRLINFRIGGLITGVLGIFCMPWRLLANPDLYINGWLIGYSGGLAAIAGVLIADYWVLRRRRLDVAALYDPEGRYRYSGGWSRPAVAATLLGCLVAWAYFIARLFVSPETMAASVNPALAFSAADAAVKLVRVFAVFYDYCWFIGLGVSFFSYLAFVRASPAARASVELDRASAPAPAPAAA